MSPKAAVCYVTGAVFALFVTSLIVTKLVDGMLLNLGWVYLSKAISQPIPQSAHLSRAQEYFEMAVPNESSSSYLGLGAVWVWKNRPDRALQAWSAGQISAQTLLAMGVSRYDQADINAALTYLMGADAMNDVNSGTKDLTQIHVGSICQRTYADPSILNRQGRAYCQDYFNEHSHNLIVDGTFSTEDLTAWQPSVATEEGKLSYGIALDDGHDEPSLSMDVQVPAKSVGLLQRISLLPGTKVRFATWIRTERTGSDFEARVLHIQYQAEDKSPGNSLLTLNDTTGWTYFEREFQLPLNAENLVTFLPVLARGQGKVWVDDVRVEVIDQQ